MQRRFAYGPEPVHVVADFFEAHLTQCPPDFGREITACDFLVPFAHATAVRQNVIAFVAHGGQQQPIGFGQLTFSEKVFICLGYALFHFQPVVPVFGFIAVVEAGHDFLVAGSVVFCKCHGADSHSAKICVALIDERRIIHACLNLALQNGVGNMTSKNGDRRRTGIIHS
ncbi:hypothetical protein DSECCO2_628240 [anaerobic digester metagenome]